MNLDTLVALAIAIGFFVFMAVELFAPAKRAMPEIRFWRLIGIAGFVVTFAVNALAPRRYCLGLPEFPRSTSQAGASGQRCRRSC